MGSTVPTVGMAAEIRAVATAWGQVVVSWAPVDAVRFAVYVDAQLVTITTASEIVVPGLESGTHNIAVVAVGETADVPTLRPEYEEGDQGLLQWDPINDPDLAKYLVDTTEVATVTIPLVTLDPDTGTGTGRLSVGGRFTGGPVNEDMVLTVAAGNVLDYSIQGQTGSVLMATNTPIQLPFGAEITPLDELTAYVVGDTYKLPLKLDTVALSETLGRGTHTFEVKGVTAMGVEGAAGSVTVFIPAPDAECTASLSTDLGLPVVDYNLAGVDASGIYVYTNIDVDGSLMDRVDELHHTAEATDLMGQITLPWDGVTSGELRVMVGVVTTWGHVVRQLDLMTMTLPLPVMTFGVPEIVDLEQVGTAVRATVAYTYQEGDDAEIIQVTRSGVSSYVDSDVLPSGEPGDTVEVIIEVAGADPDATLVTVTARAADAGAVNLGTASEAATITLDLHTPVAPTNATGVPA